MLHTYIHTNIYIKKIMQKLTDYASLCLLTQGVFLLKFHICLRVEVCKMLYCKYIESTQLIVPFLTNVTF